VKAVSASSSRRRICFVWWGDDAFEVEIVDYHQREVQDGAKEVALLPRAG